MAARDRYVVSALLALVFAGVGSSTAADSALAARPKLAWQGGAGRGADVPTVPLTLAASKDTNPDTSGTAAPIVLRLYQLKGETAFSQAEFFALLDDDQAALKSEFIGRDEYVLTPGETKNLTAAIAPETRFVGAMAAFRDIRNSEWRALVPGPIKGLTVSVERNRVRLFPD